MRQVGIVCPVEQSPYNGFLCPKKLTMEDKRYCNPCCEEKPELKEFSSREREE